jgi:hypothetical protein
MKTIRHKLDNVFPAIREKNKVIATALEALLSNSDAYYGQFMERKHEFPSLVSFLAGGEYKHDPTMSLHEQLLMAMVITKSLALDLDAGIKDRVDATGRALAQFNKEIFLLSVRKNITLERMIRFDLDENPEWCDVIRGICRKVDGGE